MLALKNILALVIFIFSLSAGAAFSVPALNSPVIDQVGLLPEAARYQISENLRQYKSTTGNQIQVFITDSLQGDSIESVAIQIFDQWKLGDEKKDNGILFLIAPKERKLRIEVGRGLEGVIPDVIAKRIIADVVAPQFRQQQYAQGIFQAIQILQQQINGQHVYDPETLKSSDEKQGINLGYWPLIFIIILYFVILVFRSYMPGNRYRGNGWSSGGYSGGGGWSSGGNSGGWSIGGGDSGGGGASGDW